MAGKILRLHVSDNSVYHVWKCKEHFDKDGNHPIVEVHPSFYEENGTPICNVCGEDMSFVETLLSVSEVQIKYEGK